MAWRTGVGRVNVVWQLHAHPLLEPLLAHALADDHPGHNLLELRGAGGFADPVALQHLLIDAKVGACA